MKKLFFTLLAMVLIVLNTKAQNPAAEEIAVKATLARFGNSWKNTDFSDMKEYMTADCQWINVVGMHWKNLKEIQFAHQYFVSGMFKGVTTQPISTTIRFITKEVAVVYSTTHVAAFYPPDGVNRGTNKQGDTDDIITYVLVKQSGKWMITSAQNVSVIKQAAASNPVLKMGK